MPPQRNTSQTIFADLFNYSCLTEGLVLLQVFFFPVFKLPALIPRIIEFQKINTCLSKTNHQYANPSVSTLENTNIFVALGLTC